MGEGAQAAGGTMPSAEETTQGEGLWKLPSTMESEEVLSPYRKPCGARQITFDVGFCCFFQRKFFLKILFIYFRLRGRDKETPMCGCLSCAPYWGPDLACNPGMCPDWESDQRLFGPQAGAQSTEPHQPGQSTAFERTRFILLLFWHQVFVGA